MNESRPTIVLTISPPTSLTINTLTYPPIHTVYIPSSSAPTSPVLLTLPTEAPSPTFLFLYPSPNSVTHLCYNTPTETLTRASTPQKPGLPGTPGVAVVQVSFWDSLSCYITPHVLSYASIVPWETTDTPCFTELPSLLQGLSGVELSNFCHDRTNYVQRLVDVRYDGVWERLFGELQLAIIAFSVLMLAEGMDRWTRLVRDVCRADQELWPGFREGFARLLEAQIGFLKRCSGDDIVAVIVTTLGEEFTIFLENYSSKVLQGLLTECGWEADHGDAPIVVG